MHRLEDGLVVGGGAAPITLNGTSSDNNAGSGASGHTMVHLGLMGSGGFRVMDPSGMSPRSGSEISVNSGTKITFPNTLFYLEITQGAVALYIRTDLGGEYHMGQAQVSRPMLLMGAGGMMYGIASGTTKYRFHKLFKEDPY